MMTLVTAIVLMAVLGLVLGMVIGWFAKLFRVESDARVELVTELLPGANCGGCGKAGFCKVGGRRGESSFQMSRLQQGAGDCDRDGARYRRRRILPAAGGGLLRW